MLIQSRGQLEAILASRVENNGLLLGKSQSIQQQRTECAGEYRWTFSASRGVIRIIDDDNDDDADDVNVGKRILKTSIINVRNQRFWNNEFKIQSWMKFAQYTSASLYSKAGKMVMKPGKVLCWALSLAIFEVDPTQDVAK